MKKIITSFLLLGATLYSAQNLVSAGGSIVAHDQDYYTKDVRNTQLIFTKKNIKDAEHVANIEELLQPLYENQFDYKLDDVLYVGLISDYNQIANGFSTQFPLNRQINYVGGTQMIDYFASTSWIDTLIYHETAHNYQINAKDSIVSSSLHTVFKNGAFFIPTFTIPNIVTSSFLLEGNAVLNESWHGNGGRLYSGRFKSIMLQQAKAGNLTPQLQYTSTLEFLYAEKNYINGSYFQYYLAKTYGLKATNSYWKNQSQEWYFPFFVNDSMRKSVGVDFESAMVEWNNSLLDDISNMKEAKGKLLARSQFFTSLNSDKDEIYFLTNETGRRAPELLRFDKSTKELKKTRESYPSGRLIKYQDKIYVQASRKSNPYRTYQGLLDSSAHFLEGSKGKMIQGYLSNDKAVYFDVSSSYDQARLYVGEDYYATVHSSVLLDAEDNIYYFIQKDKTRTLYKNHTPLYSYEGFYGLLSDVDSEGNIYFIANSQYGSSLYKFDGERALRMSEADNIIEARLINDDEVLLAAVSDKEYYYVTSSLEEYDQEPFVVRLFMEDAPYYKQAAIDKTKKGITLDLNDSYYSALDIHYSGTNLQFSSSSDVGLQYDLSINFGDPLDQNSLSLFSQRDLNEVTTAGLGYKNTQYFIRYNLQAYAVLDKPETLISRDFGVVAAAEIPLYKNGYWSASLQSSYYQDYLSQTRTPFSGALELYRAEQFGVSLRPNSLYYAKVYGALESEDLIAGSNIVYKHDLGYEFYIHADAQYSITNAPSTALYQDRGVQLTRYSSSYDPSSIQMPSLLGTLYLKEGFASHLKIEKVFNASFYYFTFPLSLQRESITLGYNAFDLKTVDKVKHYEVQEMSASVMFEFVVMNVLVFPVTLEYIENDTPEIAQEKFLNIKLGVSF